MNQIKIVNVETGEEIVREMTDEEFLAHSELQLSLQQEDKKILEAKQAREALLQKLGISQEEAKLLLS